MKLTSRCLLALGSFLLALSLGDAALGAPYRPLVGLVHLHSSVSSGIFSVEDIALRASKLGVDVVIMAENYHLRFALGPPLLPELFQVSRVFPSLTDSEMARYLKRLELLNRRHPELIVIPGVEVVPHYYWTGSLWGGDLTMHDGQKNILVIGLKGAEDYAGLPFTGNPTVARYDSRSLVRGAPLLLVLAGLGLLATKRARRYRVGGFSVTQRRRPWKTAVTLIVIGGAWSTYNAPFTVPAYSTRGPGAGVAPYQDLIDYVNARGGVSIWSYPEAKDHHVYDLPWVPRAGKFTVRTRPHPEVLLETRGYTAFGALYRDNTTAERPGQSWDQALEQYCTGERETPPRGVGELGFHGGGRKSLSDVLTVFYVEEPTAEEVLKALRSGRMYASIPNRDVRLELSSFSLRGGGRAAVMGDTLRVEAGEALALDVGLEAHDGASHPFRAVLVRNGKAWRELEGTTPFSATFEDSPPTGRRCTYYRLLMRKPHRLVTNPLFTATNHKD